MTRRPRLLVTRDAEGCARWSERLVELGAEPVVWPCLTHTPAPEPDAAGDLVEALVGARWLALSSARGAGGVEALLSRAGVPLPAPVRVAVVGSSTAQRAMEALGRVDLQARTPTAEGLARTLLRAEPAEASGPGLGPVVVATSDRGRRELERTLEAAGVVVRRQVVYRTLPADPGPRRQAVPPVDAALLASPSAVEGFLNRTRVPAALPLVTLGPTTSAAVCRAGLRVAAEAEQPSLDALYAAFLRLDTSGEMGIP